MAGFTLLNVFFSFQGDNRSGKELPSLLYCVKFYVHGNQLYFELMHLAKNIHLKIIKLHYVFFQIKSIFFQTSAFLREKSALAQLCLELHKNFDFKLVWTSVFTLN